jgi:hypothetical protein
VVGGPDITVTRDTLEREVLGLDGGRVGDVVLQLRLVAASDLLWLSMSGTGTQSEATGRASSAELSVREQFDSLAKSDMMRESSASRLLHWSGEHRVQGRLERLGAPVPSCARAARTCSR